MLSPSYLLAVIFMSIQGSCGETVMRQTPEQISASPGDTVTFTCTSSRSLTNSYGNTYLAWYQQKPHQPPNLIIYAGTTLQSGTPARFSGSGSGTEYKLTINGVKDEDEAVYYCQQTRWHSSYTFGGGTRLDIKRAGTTTPTLSIFPPSPDQLKTTEATSVCLVKQFYPKGVTVAWKGDGTAITNRIDNSESTKDENNNYNLISTLTISTSDYKKYKEITCEVSHTTLSKALVESFQTAQCSP